MHVPACENDAEIGRLFRQLLALLPKAAPVTPAELRQRAVDGRGRPLYSNPTSLAKAAGVSVSTVCEWERRGLRWVKGTAAKNVERVARQLGCRADEYTEALLKLRRIRAKGGGDEVSGVQDQQENAGG